MIRKKRTNGMGKMIFNKQRKCYTGTLNCEEPSSGLIRTKSFSAPTRREVEKRMQEWKDNLAKGLISEKHNMTLGIFLANWVTTHTISLQSKSTEKCNSTINLYLINKIGHLKLEGLSRKILQDHFNQLASSGSRKGTHLSSYTLRNAYVYLKKSLNDAVEQGYLVKNPATKIKLPPIPKKQYTTYTLEQCKTLLDAARNKNCPLLYLLLSLSLTVGLRRGESFGLKWKDIEFEKNEIRIQRSVVTLSNRIEVKSPKTASSFRTVLINSDLSEALSVFKKQQEEARKLFPKGVHDEYIFTKADGELYHPGYFVQHHFTNTLIPELGLPRIRFHDLRHTCATLLLENNVSHKVVQERLGHSSSRTTLDIYGHVTPVMQQHAITTFDAILTGTNESVCSV